ncbi:MAG: thiamine phosphate synthase [Candidatus Korobacteraceae bacterium]
MLTYYITDRNQFAGSEAEQRAQVLRTIRQAAVAGVDYIQLREKDLTVRELERLAREAVQVIRGEGPARLLINHRTDVALAAGADGVHLTGSDFAASDARALAAGCGIEPRAGDFERRFLVAVSCHSAQQVRLAEAHGADFAVLAPVFEKMSAERVTKGIGLDELRRATQLDQHPDLRVEAGESRGSFPVFALGGVDVERAPLCTAAGAAGIAGIRVFQQCSDLPALVRSLHLL